MNAARLIDDLKTLGFSERTLPNTTEIVLERHESDVYKIRIYTSVVYRSGIAEFRNTGTDAIRVQGVYRRSNNGVRNITRARVNRTGTYTRLLSRVKQRINSLTIGRMEHCTSCGAPCFTSQRGNQVCAEVCFTFTSQAQLAAARQHTGMETEAPTQQTEAVAEALQNLLAMEGAQEFLGDQFSQLQALVDVPTPEDAPATPESVSRMIETVTAVTTPEPTPAPGHTCSCGKEIAERALSQCLACEEMTV